MNHPGSLEGFQGDSGSSILASSFVAFEGIGHTEIVEIKQLVSTQASSIA